MNPIVIEAVASIIRWVLAMGAGWLVQHGVWTQANAATYVTAAALGLVSLGWSLWQKYQSRLKLVTALTMPTGTTENQVERKIATGVGVPSATTAKNVAPTA